MIPYRMIAGVGEEAPTSAITGEISSATCLRFRPGHHSEYSIRALTVKDYLPGLYLNLPYVLVLAPYHC